MQVKNYEPEWLAGTSVGEVLFQADYYLKELSMGEHGQPVIGMKSCIEASDNEKSNKDWNAREWFVVKNAEVQLSEGNALIPQVKMGVEAREQIMGASGLEDVKRTKPDHPLVKYAEAFTHNFDLIAERKSVVYHLRELAKASVMAKFLLDTEVEIDQFWFDFAAEATPICCLEIPQLWNDHVRSDQTGTRVYGGVQFGLDRFSLAQTRAGAPMARAASLSATMMRAPTGVRAGISATLRAPGISAALGARAGISATSLAPSVFPQAFRAAPGALRTARGVDLNLDEFNLSQATKVSSDEICDVPIGNAFWSALETNSKFEEEYQTLFSAVFNTQISDRRDEGDRFIPPNMSISYLEKLGNLVKEEQLVQ